MNDLSHETTRMDQEARLLYLMDSLRRPVVDAAIQMLHLSRGSRGLDVGCGIGLQALRLAEAVGPSGRVTGVDVSPRSLEQARRLAEQSDLAGRVAFREGDMNKLPFADDSFDWLWSADCAGYHPTAKPLRLLDELARVVKPGGTVALLAWSSQMLLPGYPMLEARLNETHAGIAPFNVGMAPDCHFLRALGWLRKTGLERTTVQTLTGTVHAPLDEDIRAALSALLEMRWAGAAPEMSASDWAQFQRLCRPGSPDFILDRPDYYAFFTYSMFSGQVAG